ncbi:MAG: aldo/keto reductase [Acidobacteriia bacterium]|nr:aldo/keto reductase [Terriglobia bacterium]
MSNNAKLRRIGTVATYHLLGRSGLRVSPLCLGAMTFGEDWGWGATEGTVRKLLDRYLEAGGNFIDTADGYTGGHSEEILGRYLKVKKNRERVVLATKFTFNSQPGDPNAGGNGRKNILRALEGSLRRLQTDSVDLYWLHAWDMLTPVEEVMATVDALVRAGKVRYFGLSDVPAWYLARAQTIAELRGTEPVCALQLEYSLVERTIEREHIPAALELGMGVCPWSPLASGLLAGKYKPAKGGVKGSGRLATAGGARFSKATERNWRIVDEVLTVAKEIGRSPAQVALNWVTRRPGVASTIIGATTLAQLEVNLAALEFEIPEMLAARLEAASRPEPVFPYYFFSDDMQSRLRGGVSVSAEPSWFRRR